MRSERHLFFLRGAVGDTITCLYDSSMRPCRPTLRIKQKRQCTHKTMHITMYTHTSLLMERKKQKRLWMQNDAKRQKQKRRPPQNQHEKKSRNKFEKRETRSSWIIARENDFKILNEIEERGRLVSSAPCMRRTSSTSALRLRPATALRAADYSSSRRVIQITDLPKYLNITRRTSVRNNNGEKRNRVTYFAHSTNKALINPT